MSALSLALVAPLSGSQAAPASGEVQIIQAAPGVAVSVSIDGKQVRSRVGVGKVIGPYNLTPGKHEVRFVGPAGKTVMRTAVRVRTGTNSDVVLHRPASPMGKEIVNVYSTPRAAIGPGKARVLVAHTATVAPADVRVDGTKIFTNIANGEFATADVPAGKHRVELLPTGKDTYPILGPIDVTLKPQTVTMVYAVGTPKNGSMRVIAHSAELSPDGSVKPSTIETGSAGLAAHTAVAPFSVISHTGAAASAATWAGLGLPVAWVSSAVRGASAGTR